jgi:outer membrane protein assembly factor BamB
MTHPFVRAIIAAALCTPIARAADWTEYHGPKHDSSSTETIAAFSTEGPRELWRIKMGEGFGTYVAAGGKAYLTCEDGGIEKCVALDAATGKPLWTTPMDNRTIHESQGGNGPRSTPAIDGDRIYVLGTYLKLLCLDAKSGKPIWGHDIDKEYHGQSAEGSIGKWGNAASPVLDGDLVFIVGGGSGKSLMAFDKKSGKVAWAHGDEKLTHATPTIATIQGIRQVIFYTQSGLVACETIGGKELWRFPVPFKVSSAASPVVYQDVVYCAAAYGVGGAACEIIKSDKGLAAKELWRNKDMQNHWSTPVCKDGYVYGLYGWRALGTAPLKCVDIKTGKQFWSHDGFGQGGIQLVGDRLVVLGDAGQLVVVEASPDGYKELSRAQPLHGKCWNMPVVSEGRLFARSSDPGKGEAVCLDVSQK